MATIQLPRNRGAQTPNSPALIQPGPQGPDPVVEAFAEGAERTGGFLEKLAEQERQQLDQLYRNSIEAELSQFELESAAKIIEFETNGTGDKPFVGAVMEDFKERASQVGASYSQELRDEIKVKLLPVQERTALSAMAVQKRKEQEQVLANAEIFQNNIVNQVRFGLVGEQAALARTEQFLSTVPDNLRLQVGTQAREMVRSATMARAAEADPASFIRRAKAGEFNDLDPTAVDRMYDGAVRTVLVRQEQAARQAESIQKLSFTDPVGAARRSLAARGNGAPTADQLRAEQIRLGISESALATLDKDTAIAYGKQLKNAPSPDVFQGLVEEMRVRMIEQGKDPEAAKRDIVRFAKDEGMGNLAHALEVAADPTGSYQPLYRQATFEILRDPKAGEAAKKLLGKEQADDVETKVAAALSQHESIMSRSGFDQAEILAIRQGVLDRAYIAKSISANAGDENFDVSMVLPPESLVKPRLDEVNGYHVPADLENTFSTEYMRSLRDELIADAEFSPSYPSALRQSTDFKRDAGWVNGPDGSVVLKVRGVEVYSKTTNRPIVKTWQELQRKKFEDDEKRRAAEEKVEANRPTPVGSTTIVVQ